MLTRENSRNKLSFIDRRVGENLKAFRNMKGISQAKLAGEVGITFQQLQKYENGMNRISASRMYVLAESLDISINDFYLGLEGANENTPSKSGIPYDMSASELELVSLYKKIQDRQLRNSLLSILRTVTK